MYLPLTGFDKILEKKKRGVKVSVEAVGSSAGGVDPTQVQGAEKPEMETKVPAPEISEPKFDNNNISNNNSNNNSNNQNTMHTEDFISLHNSSGQDQSDGALDAIKDIMALKMLEKTLETINKIME